MADDYLIIHSRKGRLRYKREDPDKDPTQPSRLFSQIQPRYHRPSRVVISRVHDPLRTEGKQPGERIQVFTKLAGSRDNAFRFFRSVISTQPKNNEVLPTRNIKRERSQAAGVRQEEREDMPSVDVLRGGAATRLGPSPLARPHLVNEGRQNSVASQTSTRSTRAGSGPTIPEEKPLVAGNGVSLSVNLAEPLLFLQGHDQHDNNTRSTAMLRGSLHLKVQKSAKIRAVTLKFKGTAVTKWPEGELQSWVDLNIH